MNEADLNYRLRQYVYENPTKAFWLMRDVLINTGNEKITLPVGDSITDYIDRRFMHYVENGKDNYENKKD